MRVAPLPSVIASSLSTIQWPLNIDSSPPLFYEPLDRLKEIRVTKQQEEKSPLWSAVQDVSGTVESVCSALAAKEEDDNTTGKQQQQYAVLSLALLFLGHGFTDEAHDLVTPLSWPEPTHFGHTPPSSSPLQSNAVFTYQPSSPVSVLAAHIHSLIHRREGYHLGEFGMIGFQNSNYWANTALNTGPKDIALHRELREAVMVLAKGNSLAEQWCTNRLEADYWEPRALSDLCAKVLKAVRDDKEKDDKAGVMGKKESNPYVAIQDFAERAAEMEVRLLLRFALQQAGFDCHNHNFAATAS